MYKIYLKIYNHLGKSEVLTDTRTTTPSPAAAEVAFRELISRADLKGSSTHAVLSLNKRRLMLHRFDCKPDNADFVAPDAEIKLFHDD